MSERQGRRVSPRTALVGLGAIGLVAVIVAAALLIGLWGRGVPHGSFAQTGSMGTAHGGGTATLLSDGRVLVAGGRGVDGKVLASVEVFDPATGKFSPTGSMGTARQGSVSVLLPDGRVLISGGQDGNAEFLASAELYDPATASPASPA